MKEESSRTSLCLYTATHLSIRVPICGSALMAGVRTAGYESTGLLPNLTGAQGAYAGSVLRPPCITGCQMCSGCIFRLNGVLSLVDVVWVHSNCFVTQCSSLGNIALRGWANCLSLLLRLPLCCIQPTSCTKHLLRWPQVLVAGKR